MIYVIAAAFGLNLLISLVVLFVVLRLFDYSVHAKVNYQAQLISLNFNDIEPAGEVDPSIICSLTTIPSRLTVVHYAIESIILQSVRPLSIELYVTDDLSKELMPQSLLRLEPYGVNIHFVPDVGPHTKLIYALRDFPDSTIVTIDDDIYYPPEAISTLRRTSRNHPQAIVANWARRMRFALGGQVYGARKGTLLTPPQIMRIEWARNDPQPDLLTYPYGTGGVLYPPGSLHGTVHDVALFRTLCPTEDDIWFKAMAILNETPAVHTGLGFKPSHRTIEFSQHTALRHINHANGRNERQLRKVFDHFNLYDLLQKRDAETRRAGK